MRFFCPKSSCSHFLSRFHRQKTFFCERNWLIKIENIINFLYPPFRSSLFRKKFSSFLILKHFARRQIFDRLQKKILFSFLWTFWKKVLFTIQHKVSRYQQNNSQNVKKKRITSQRSCIVTTNIDPPKY